MSLTTGQIIADVAILMFENDTADESFETHDCGVVVRSGNTVMWTDTDGYGRVELCKSPKKAHALFVSLCDND
jgi:hypothetical protein